MLSFFKLDISVYKSRFAKCALLLLLCLLTFCSKDKIEVSADNKDIELKWANIADRFEDVNSLHISCITSDGKILSYNKGVNTNGIPVNENTIFEAASLSKTYFAYLYWKLLLEHKISTDPVPVKSCDKNSTMALSPYSLLSHTSQIRTDSCAGLINNAGVFSYSEYGYLALQNYLEKTISKNLEQICQEELTDPNNFYNTSYMWRPANINYVNGYVKNNELHREIHKYDTARANGTLYTDGKELAAFVKLLMHSNVLDSMQLPVTNVPGYSNLYWGRGLGIELNNNKKYCWHWGNNWSFNSFIIINKTDNTAIVILTNSVSGRIAIKETVNWLLNTDLQAFTYVGW